MYEIFGIMIFQLFISKYSLLSKSEKVTLDRVTCRFVEISSTFYAATLSA